MLISSQNHTNRTMHNPTVFRGNFLLSNVAEIAQKTDANFTNDFDNQRKSRRAKTPPQQIAAMMLPGNKDFDVRYKVIPSSIGNASTIEAIVSADGCEGKGLISHPNKMPRYFGENIVKVTQKAVDAVASSVGYIAKRADFVQRVRLSRGTNIQGLSEVCEFLSPKVAHDFLTGLGDAIARTKTDSVSLSIGTDRNILAVMNGHTSTIKIPRLGILRTEGRILADRLLKVLC